MTTKRWLEGASIIVCIGNTDIPVNAVQGLNLFLSPVLTPIIVEVSFPDISIDALAHESVHIVSDIGEENFKSTERLFYTTDS